MVASDVLRQRPNCGRHAIRRKRNNCASDSYRFDLTTNVTASGSTLSGIWSETSRNVNGTLGGKINGGDIDALVEALKEIGKP